MLEYGGGCVCGVKEHVCGVKGHVGDMCGYVGYGVYGGSVWREGVWGV